MLDDQYISMHQCAVIDMKFSDYMINEHLFDQVRDVILNIGEAQALIIKGSNDLFCSGLNIIDLVEKKKDSEALKRFLLNFKKTLDLISSCEIPTIAQVDGNVLGGGLGIICVCDIVIMNDLVEISMPETIMGLIPAVIFPYVAMRTSSSLAKKLSLGTKPLIANDCLSLGLADEVTNNTYNEVKKYVKRISRIDQYACGFLKKIYNKYYLCHDDEYFKEAVDAFTQLISKDSTKERIKSFREGRAPWDV